MKCEQCGNKSVVEEVRQHSFQYGQDDPVTLTTPIIVMRCTVCMEEWTDYRAEDARQAVVDTFLNGLG